MKWIALAAPILLAPAHCQADGLGESVRPPMLCDAIRLDQPVTDSARPVVFQSATPQETATFASASEGGDPPVLAESEGLTPRELLELSLAAAAGAGGETLGPIAEVSADMPFDAYTGQDAASPPRASAPEQTASSKQKKIFQPPYVSYAPANNRPMERALAYAAALVLVGNVVIRLLPRKPADTPGRQG